MPCVEPRHICLLFRRFFSYGEDVTRPYVEALEARGVPHLLVGGKTFHDREEVETMRAALPPIEWPDDELSVFATLRGALFAIGDEELLEYQPRATEALHPFRVPTDAAGLTSADRATRSTLLRRLHAPAQLPAGRRHHHELLDATRAHVGFVLRPAGEQALANVLHVAELARQYEVGGGMSFRGFVEDAATTRRTAAQAAEAPILEEGSDGVRLMTVHKAKGLEFPVVILADITAKLDVGSRRPPRRSREQRVRPAARPMDAEGAGDGRTRPRSPRDEARRRARRVCRGDPRARSARRARGRRCGVGGRLDVAAQCRDLSLRATSGVRPSLRRAAPRSRRIQSGGGPITIPPRDKLCAPGSTPFSLGVRL